MANNTGSSLQSTVSLYTRLANATRGAGYTQEQMLNVTDALNKAFVISGATMQEASNAAIQLSQGLASGTLRGEELNSVMEQGPRITRALADYLGVTNGQIRQLAADGKITGDVVTNALLKSLTSLNAELAKMPRTFEQASQALKNNFLAAIGQINVDPVVSSVDALAKSLAQPDVVMGIQRIANGLGSLVAVGGSGLKTVVENTDALIAVAGAYATKVGVGVVSSLALSVKARLADTAAANQQLVAARQSELAAASEAVAIHSVTVATAEASLARAIYARSEAMAATQAEISSVKSLKAVAAQLAADRQLEIQRMQAQITNTGLTASHTRLAEIRTSEAAIANQLATAEGRLAVSRQAELAAGAVVGQQTVALNAIRTDGVAILGAQTAAQNALNAAERQGVIGRTAGAAALAAFGGPLGLITLGLSAAAGAAIYFASSTDSATQSLIDQNLTLDDSISKYKALNDEQRQFQAQTWLRKQKEEAGEAASALERYEAVAIQGLSATGADAQKALRDFKALFAEVESGQKPLGALTTWIFNNTSTHESYRAKLVDLANTYSTSSEQASKYNELLSRSKTSTDGAASSTKSLSSAQQASAAAVGGGQQAWEKYISQLTQTRDLVGANTAQEAAYTAAKAGFNSQQVQYAKLIGEQTDLLKKYEDAIKSGKKTDIDRLKTQLTASITASDAIKKQMESQASSVKKMAENAEASAKRQVDAIQTVIDQTVRYAKGLTLVETYQSKQNLQGSSLLTFGQAQPPKLSTTPAKVKTAAEQAQEMIDQVFGNTTPNKTSTKTEKGLSSKLNEAKTAFDSLYKAAQPAKFALQEYVERQSQLELLLSKGKITQQQYNEALAQSSINYAAAIKGAQGLTQAEQYRAQVQRQLATQQAQYQAEAAAVGMGQKEADRMQARLQIEQDTNNRILQLQTELANAQGEKQRQDLQAQIDIEREFLQKRVAAQREGWAQIDQAQADWSNGARGAFQDYMDSARDVAGQTRNLFSNAFGNMEDAVVNFVKTGKLSFKDFADQVVADLIRIQVRQAAAGFLGTALGFLGGGGGAAAAGSGTMTGFSETISRSGFSTGGYTGDGGKFEPMGVVHGGEYVIRKEVVSQPGARDYLDRLNAKGYASGGFVGVSPAVAAAPVPAAPTAGAMPSIIQHISVQGTADEATLARIQQAAQKGAQDGYNLVLRDLKTNGPARQLIARNR
ncbi:TPA: phage tail tape measure protein [Pseudomonas putida]|nr:phage tail tape measure protein [Pseudomonas putida]